MNNFNSEEEEEEVIYDYYEKRKKNSKFFPILLIMLVTIIINLADSLINMENILTLENISLMHENDFESLYSLDDTYDDVYEDDYSSKDVAENSNSNNKIFEFNNKFEVFFGEKVPASDVKKLLSAIDINNHIETDRKIRILFHVSGSSSTSGTIYYELSGTSTSMDNYIKEIKKDYYYYVDVHETNPDGTISSIVISDNVYKHSYKNRE